MRSKRFRKSLKATAATVFVGGALLSSSEPTMADDAASPDDLKARVAQLEGILQKEGILPSGKAPKLVSAMTDISISGFVQASYFYNTETPSDGVSDAYLWNAKHNSFSINKVKLTFVSKPVEASGDKWDAAFRTSLIWGEDSPNLNTGSPSAGFEALREAYVELNVPIGTGLNVRAGQLISLLNWESGDGGAVNANFSQGYQWYYTGNGPSAGVQLGYTFTDWLDIKVRVQNGLYAGAIDNNRSKTFMGSIGLKPMKDLWISLIGFQSLENTSFSFAGGSVLAGYQVTKELGLGLEFDYFRFDPNPAPKADLWSIG